VSLSIAYLVLMALHPAARTTSLCSGASHLFACLSIFFFCSAYLDLGFNKFIGNLPSELGHLSELSECIDCVPRRASALLPAARTTSLCSGVSHLFACLSISFFSVQRIWIWVSTNSSETCLASLATCQN
jgi:hypothetical protein